MQRHHIALRRTDRQRVGGSLGVNVHGRYMGLGPVIMSVRWFRIVLADGSVAEATREDNPELFFAAVGGYGGLGVIVEVELDLVRGMTHDFIKMGRALKEAGRAQQAIGAALSTAWTR